MQNTGKKNPAAKKAAAPAQRRPPMPPVPPEFQAAAIMKLDSPQLVALLKDPKSTEFQKAKACMRLAMVGTKDAVPVVAALLPDPKFSHYARFALVPIPDPSVDDALRAALGKTKGALLVGVIDSIGQRKDAKAVEPLAKLMYGADVDVARAAAAALGLISGPQAATALRGALVKTKGPVQTAAAEAGLVCAEGLMAKNDRKGAFALYDTLSRQGMPRSVRLAAMHSTIDAETALTRPR